MTVHRLLFCLILVALIGLGFSGCTVTYGVGVHYGTYWSDRDYHHHHHRPPPREKPERPIVKPQPKPKPLPAKPPRTRPAPKRR